MLFIGLLLLAFLLIITFIIPYFYKNNSSRIKSFKCFLKPSKDHWMGTDCLGHDLFEYIIKGTKMSLYISICTVLISSIIGCIIGILSGYFLGFFNILANLICDFIVVFPDFILALLIVLLYGKSVCSLIFAISICYIPTFVKNMRAATMQIAQKDFVKSAICLGASNFYIIRKHIFPHILYTLIIRISLSLSSIILLAASFGFIGLGLDPSIPEWGSLLSINKSYINIYPRLIFFPMIIILLTNLSFNFIAEGLVNYLNYDQKNLD
ncbi:ABC transporter permease [Candidatus Phytoplasma sacchari]|nr:ABC transporter permease [Candidatus Phytoplasma sacchari]KAB8122185.1 ABC transporter permease [Candidatus Phytoplasma sacchari]